ncbi:MAG: hypothetical protein K2G70_00135 [Turicibacter sp.]|nr:hypothetical protein [Turicibacter sp.]
MKKRWGLIITILVLSGCLFSCSASGDQKTEQTQGAQESMQHEPWSLIR